MRRRSRSSLGSWWKPTATPVACCPTLDNASPADDLVGEQSRILENIAKYRPQGLLTGIHAVAMVPISPADAALPTANTDRRSIT